MVSGGFRWFRVVSCFINNDLQMGDAKDRLPKKILKCDMDLEMGDAKGAHPRPSSYSHVIIGLGLARQGGAGLYHLESVGFSVNQLRFKEKCS